MNSVLTEPMLIEVPGIPGKLRSQTLDEYMQALIPEHPARKELAQIRSLALDGMKLGHDLIVALQKINELEARIKTLENPAPPAPVAAELAVEAGIAPPPPGPKAECPTCHVQISATPGPWASHQKRKHGLSGVPIPPIK